MIEVVSGAGGRAAYVTQGTSNFGQPDPRFRDCPTSMSRRVPCWLSVAM